MKKTNFIALALTICLALCLILTACGKKPAGSNSNAPGADTKTLESVVATDSSMKEEFEKAMAANEGLLIEIKGNDITYTYDLTVLGVDSETLKSDVMKASLDQELDKQKTIFGDLCKTAEEQTGINGVRTVVNYTAGEELLISKVFTSADAE